MDMEMSIYAHLNELRKRLFYCTGSFFFLFIILFFFMNKVLKVLIPEWLKPVVLSPSEAFFTYIRIDFWLTFIMLIPFLLLQIWMFVKPALTKRERRILFFFMPFSIGLFIGGLVFGYFIVFPFSLHFFWGFGGEDYIRMISLERYVAFALNCILPFGLVFQFPNLVFVLYSLGFLSPETLIRWRKGIIITIFIMAAWITPPDVVSQVLLALPLMGLYELTILVMKQLERKKLSIAASRTKDE